jgi:esterase/lipase
MNDEKNWDKIETPPLVIVQGQFDKVAFPGNSIKFFEKVKTKDKNFLWYPKMWNAVLF